MNSSHFSSLLISWYDKNKRDLPWRNTTNPYFIWLSEIILQQTRVNQGLPYYNKFINEYPSIKNLAEADEEVVLRLWQGLGYYSRARNMHSTAKAIQNLLGGKFPDSYDEILKLKGIGKYTAGAIASFAFKEVVPVADGNVMRVISRVFGLEYDISSTVGQKEFLAKAKALLPDERTDVYNQAIMEFGATVCLPKKPDCSICIFKSSCFAFEKDMIGFFPVKSKKITKKERKFTYFVIRYRDKLLMHRREGRDIWQGLYQFYLRESHLGSISDFLPDEIIEPLLIKYKLNITEASEIYTHVLTHQLLRAKYWVVDIADDCIIDIGDFKDFKFYSKDEVDALPKPVLINNYLSKEYF